MFYYYGAKRALSAAYDPPRYRTVVEPFAGSGQYAVRCLLDGLADRVVLTDLDPRVIAMWQRLLAMTPAEVLALPPLEVGQFTTDPLAIVTGASNSWGSVRRLAVSERMAAAWPRQLHNIAEALPYVAGRVTVTLGDYTTAQQTEPATYFVDPPYQTVRADGTDDTTASRTAAPKGKGYAKGCDSDALDFSALGKWCQQLEGHVIAVDQEGADWLPFEPLRRHRSSVGAMHTEVVWTTGGRDHQAALF